MLIGQIEDCHWPNKRVERIKWFWIQNKWKTQLWLYQTVRRWKIFRISCVPWRDSSHVQKCNPKEYYPASHQGRIVCSSKHFPRHLICKECLEISWIQSAGTTSSLNPGKNQDLTQNLYGLDQYLLTLQQCLQPFGNFQSCLQIMVWIYNIVVNPQVSVHQLHCIWNMLAQMSITGEILFRNQPNHNSLDQTTEKWSSTRSLQKKDFGDFQHDILFSIFLKLQCFVSLSWCFDWVDSSLDQFFLLFWF